MVKKCFILQEEGIDVFHDKLYMTTIEKRSFHLAHVIIMDSMECGKAIDDFFHNNS